MGICTSNDSGHEYNTLGYSGGNSSGATNNHQQKPVKRGGSSSSSSRSSLKSGKKREPTPPPPIKYPTPPPPRDPTPPPKDPTPPPKDPTPPPKDPTPPPKDPTPPPKDPTPPPKDPTPPPKDPTPPPPRQPTPPPEEPNDSTQPPTEPSPPPILCDPETDQQTPDQFQEESKAKIEIIPETKTSVIPLEKENEMMSGELNYRRNKTLGTLIIDLDFRTEGEEYDTEAMFDTFEDDSCLYVDKEFTLQDALGSQSSNLFWKRPGDIASEPCLFSEGTTRYDIGQGTIGTCWFLSMVSVIADKPHLMEQVIPDGSYPIGTPTYNGSFRCRFWRYGRFEDVFIDDFLPCRDPYNEGNYQIVSAHSATDKNEMWVSLLEKAFARSYGSYEAVTGGLCADSFLALTSGVPEHIKFDEMNMTKKQLFRRIKNSLRSGAMVACSVPERYHDHCGLVGGHAYSLTGVKELDVDLVRVRNPWGHHEWTGDWSDKSPLWDNYGGMEEHDDGEFYMSLDDFTTYFDDVTICCLLPDFDRDGKADSSLNCIANIYGNWRGETAAGFKNKYFNPKYLIEVPESAYADADGGVALVLHMIQRTKQRKRDFLSIRCDIYKVLQESDDGVLVLEELGVNTNSYSKLQQTTSRHLVTPGKYIIIPSSINEGDEKEFLVRVFTADPLKMMDHGYPVRDITDEDKYKLLFEELPKEIDGYSTNLPFCRLITGAWTENNGGGQAQHSTVDINPQYKVTVHEKGFVLFTLMQQLSKSNFALGFRMWKVEDEYEFPMTVNFIYSHYEDNTVVWTMDNKDGKFVSGPYVNCPYVLEPGEYLILTFLDNPSDRTKFALSVRSQHQVEIEARNLH